MCHVRNMWTYKHALCMYHMIHNYLSVTENLSLKSNMHISLVLIFFLRLPATSHDISFYTTGWTAELAIWAQI